MALAVFNFLCNFGKLVFHVHMCLSMVMCYRRGLGEIERKTPLVHEKIKPSNAVCPLFQTRDHLGRFPFFYYILVCG